MKYILRDKQVIEATLIEWSRWFETADRTVKKTLIDGVEISTVFIGLDNGMFETMIFEGKHDPYQERYKTWDKAVEGHNIAVKLVKEA